MHRPFVRRPKALAALAGLALAIGLAVIPAQAQSTPHYERPVATGSIGRGAAPGGPVTREQVIARAEHWVKKEVAYSQARWWKDDVTGGSYRQDCSGFVSMAWQLKESLTTQSLPAVANRLSGFDQLQAGDALDHPAAHAMLFGGWIDKAKGDFVYYSQSRSGRPARKDTANIHDSRIAGHPRTAYIPLRYKKIAATAQAPAATATAVPSTPATATTPPKPEAKPKPKPMPSTSTAASAKPGATAPAASPPPSASKPPAASAPPSASKPPAGTAGGPTAAARPDATTPRGGCAPTVRVSFWQWIFSF
ncbi:hypothetical protein [Streptomyces sp. NPDC048349]|uniref:hypothetical protein n=1 Tax=Streptomyces sp. NPDC048349 TaxID=3155486 RepID=UPI003419756C